MSKVVVKSRIADNGLEDNSTKRAKREERVELSFMNENLSFFLRVMGYIMALCIIVPIVFAIGASCQEESLSFLPQSFMVTVEKLPKYNVVYQRDSKVMYVVSRRGLFGNRGEYTQLVNADGSPMLYEGNAIDENKDD